VKRHVSQYQFANHANMFASTFTNSANQMLYKPLNLVTCIYGLTSAPQVDDFETVAVPTIQWRYRGQLGSVKDASWIHSIKDYDC
jgi:hypothetical protein